MGPPALLFAPPAGGLVAVDESQDMLDAFAQWLYPSGRLRRPAPVVSVPVLDVSHHGAPQSDARLVSRLTTTLGESSTERTPLEHHPLRLGTACEFHCPIHHFLDIADAFALLIESPVPVRGIPASRTSPCGSALGLRREYRRSDTRLRGEGDRSGFCAHLKAQAT